MNLAESFRRSAFARFVNAPSGRFARIIAGLGLIAWGYTQRGSATGLIFMVVGLVPLVTGAFDLCVVSALLGGPISGAGSRKRTA